MYVPVVSVSDGAAVLYLDVADDQVVGARVENNSASEIAVHVSTPGRAVFSRTFAPGTTTDISINGGRRFRYGATLPDDSALADWRVNVVTAV